MDKTFCKHSNCATAEVHIFGQYELQLCVCVCGGGGGQFPLWLDLPFIFPDVQQFTACGVIGSIALRENIYELYHMCPKIRQNTLLTHLRREIEVILVICLFMFPPLIWIINNKAP